MNRRNLSIFSAVLVPAMAVLLEGILFIVMGFVRPPPGTLVGVLIGGIVVMLVILFGYTHRVWKGDPARGAT